LPVWLGLCAYSGQPGGKVSIAAACDSNAPLTTKALRSTETAGREYRRSPAVGIVRGRRDCRCRVQFVSGVVPLWWRTGGDPFHGTCKGKPRNRRPAAVHRSKCTPQRRPRPAAAGPRDDAAGGHVDSNQRPETGPPCPERTV
jgi:hypothetical protein